MAITALQHVSPVSMKVVDDSLLFIAWLTRHDMSVSLIVAGLVDLAMFSVSWPISVSFLLGLRWCD